MYKKLVRGEVPWISPNKELLTAIVSDHASLQESRRDEIRNHEETQEPKEKRRLSDVLEPIF